MKSEGQSAPCICNSSLSREKPRETNRRARNDGVKEECKHSSQTHKQITYILTHTHTGTIKYTLLPLSALILKFNMCVFVTSVQRIICSNLSVIAFWYAHKHAQHHRRRQVLAPAPERKSQHSKCRGNRGVLWITACVLSLGVISAPMRGRSFRGGKYIPDIRDVQPDWT